MTDAKELMDRVINERRFTTDDSRCYWLLVTHPKNFEVMKAKNIAAMKAKRKSFAEKVEIGDKVVFYLTKIGKFGGVAEFTSKVREDKTKIFTEESSIHLRGENSSHLGGVKKDEEVHPWRFNVKFEVALDEDKYVPSEEFKDKLKYLKKWPAKYWKLGFQGNVHEIPEEDYKTIKTDLRRKDRG